MNAVLFHLVYKSYQSNIYEIIHFFLLETKVKMDYLLLLIPIALIIIFLFKSSGEHMTNKDLLSTLNAFSQSSKKSSLTPNEEPIYGPKIPEMEEPVPAASGNNVDSTSVYPDIYGPEITPVPGKKKKDSHKKHGKNSSDTVNDETYEFNPDFKNAFPTEENEPQPFLTDFSKFQH